MNEKTATEPRAEDMGASKPTDSIRIERLEDGQLIARGDGRKPIAVHARRCFPWAEPNRHITLRDKDDEEVALIEDLAELDAESRAAVEAGLAEAAFVFEIDHIYDIKTEFEIRNWKVRTRQGRVTFQTKRDEWPRQTPLGGIVIGDVAGNLFEVKDPSALDEPSRKRLWAFTD